MQAYFDYIQAHPLCTQVEVFTGCPEFLSGQGAYGNFTQAHDYESEYATISRMVKKGIIRKEKRDGKILLIGAAS